MSEAVKKLEIVAKSRPDTVRLSNVAVGASVSSSETHAALTSVFNEIEGVETDFAAVGVSAVAALRAMAREPDVFFFEAQDAQDAAQCIRVLRSPTVGFSRYLVVIIPEPTKAATVELLQSGADDVLSTRPDSIDIARSLARVKARDIAFSHANDIDDQQGPKLLVVIHASGGQGATTFAVNAAVQLQTRAKDTGGACLFDLDLQFGDAHLQLDIKDHSRMLDLLRAPERLDHRMLDDLTVAGPNGLRVFTTPETPMPLEALTSDAIERLLSLARRRHRYVVVDMPVTLTRWTETVLRKADHIFLVTQVNVPALRATRRLLDVLAEERATNAPITIVANRYGGKGQTNPISQSQAEKALDRRIGASLPNDFALVSDSLDQGVPISTLRPASKVSLALSDALDAVVGASGSKVQGGLAATFAKFGRK